MEASINHVDSFLNIFHTLSSLCIILMNKTYQVRSRDIFRTPLLSPFQVHMVYGWPLYTNWRAVERAKSLVDIRESRINCGGQMKWPEILTCLPIGQLALKTTNKPAMECWNDDTCLQTMQGVQSPSSAGSMTPFSMSTSKKLSRTKYGSAI